MEFLRKWWAQTQAFLLQLPFATRALVVMILVVFGAIAFTLIWLAGSPTMVPILPVPADRVPTVRARLEMAGIRVETRGTQVLVPVDKQNDAIAILAQNDLLSDNVIEAWNAMVAQQNPFRTNSQNTQLFMLAKQKVLTLIIGKMQDVHSADVMLDIPSQQGFGATATHPSASVNLVMQPGHPVEKHLVEAVAGLVCGAVSGLKPQDVVVIDANIGRQFKVHDAEDGGAAEHEEAVHKLEDYMHTKINDLLAYIPGVIIAVNVRTDSVVSKTSKAMTYDKSEPLRRETSEERERRSGGDGAESGVRPNVGASIDTGGGAKTTEHETKTSTEYADKPMLREELTREGGGDIQRVNVAVNVPRSYFVGVYKSGKPGDTPDPDEAALKNVVDLQLAQIQEQVKTVVVTGKDDGLVTVNMIPDLALRSGSGMGGPGASTSLAAVAPLAGFLGSDMGKTAGVGALALVALGMIFVVTRWATRLPHIPTVEEMAGVPKALPVEDDLVGEADAQDPTMAGVELDENQIRSRKIAEQIGEMVKSNPGEAATLFSRWIRKED